MSNDDLAQPDATTPTSPASTAQKPPSGGLAVSVGQIIAGILFILVVIFVAENTADVKVRIIAGPKVNAPVFVWLLASAVLGALIAALMRLRRKHNAKVKAKARANS